MTNLIKQKPMRTVWHSLLWKEWHEHRSKLLALTLMIFILPLLFYKNDPQTILVTVSVTLLCHGVLAGLFVGMGTAAGENQRGTMPFLQSLPISMARPAAMKLLLSVLTVNVPVLLVVGLAFIYLEMQSYHPYDMANVLDFSSLASPFGIGVHSSLRGWSAATGLMSMLFTSSLLLWMAAIAVNRSDEIRAGAIGFLVIALIWGAFILAANFADRASLHGLGQCLAVPLAAAPGATGHLFNVSQELRVPVVLLAVPALVGHGFVFTWYLRRFGRQAVRPARTLGGQAATGTNLAWLAPPRRSQLTAIIWKQVYETGPLCLGAAGAVILMSCLFFTLNSESRYQESYGEVLGGITLGVGYLVTVVVGMGVFLEDVKPQIGIFWRSRPINTTLWFFVKFFTGLTVLAITFGTLLLMASFFQGDQPIRELKNLGVQVGFFALIFLLLYTLSMASYCLGSQPVLAAVAAIGVFVFGVYGGDYLLYNSLPEKMRPSAAFALCMIAQIATTTLAWLTVRYNWGWHK